MEEENIIIEETISEETEIVLNESTVQETVQIVQLENYESIEGLLILIVAILFATFLTKERSSY